MTILVTGAAGFIGSALVTRLLGRGDSVVGIDNHNDYYDPALKEARLSLNEGHPNFIHLRVDIADKDSLESAFKTYNPRKVVNLAAQAGVRYSIENPASYVQNNIVGFSNILENCRAFEVEHLVYASSSSVYGGNQRLPFSVNDPVAHPLSVYAASKKSNELMAHAYSHLFKIPTTGLRFFTVYGPWGRPDMALFKFTRAILNETKIPLFNHGKHLRDFTYIDDIITGVTRVLDCPAREDLSWAASKGTQSSSSAPWRVYNIGNNNPVKLMDYVATLEKYLGKKAEFELLPMQQGDVPDTYADVSELVSDFDYKPSTTIDVGIKKFIDWYMDYYNVNR